mmetsp:Transcript_37404/g.82014  ORF Transcript_37404/g.82014 Transcript_37404/m.82014 type:complete len:201 (+) Transcript_37404:1071-1673(+)
MRPHRAAVVIATTSATAATPTTFIVPIAIRYTLPIDDRSVLVIVRSVIHRSLPRALRRPSWHGKAGYYRVRIGAFQGLAGPVYLPNVGAPRNSSPRRSRLRIPMGDFVRMTMSLLLLRCGHMSQGLSRLGLERLSPHHRLMLKGSNVVRSFFDIGLRIWTRVSGVGVGHFNVVIVVVVVLIKFSSHSQARVSERKTGNKE